MPDVDVLVIGAGFSGLGIAALLDRAGIASFRILESAGDVGGTWRDNTYPGCGCDIPSPLYSFSFDQKADWTRLFARQPEIHDYLRGVANRRGLIDRTQFHTSVVAARWLAEDARWELTTASGQRHRARWLVHAVGPLHHPVIPDVPGIGDFQGPVFHTAAWDHTVDLTGRRVVVVGTGASAIQLVPAVVDRVAALTVFQRTPPWIVPKLDRAFDRRHRWLARRVPPYRRWVRNRLFWTHESRAAGFVSDPSKMAATAGYARELLERQVPDPVLRAALTPDYEIGCKRLLISSDWYPALSHDRVDVRTTGLAEVRAHAVVGADGVEVPADVLVFSTGFDAHETVTRMTVTGRGGVDLGDTWRADKRAYLGTTVAGFPNMFVMVGPNTALGHNSQVFMIEAQARYVVDCIRRATRRGARSLEVRPEVQRAFGQWLDGRMAATVWQTGGCRSWYLDPRSGRNTMLWPDTTVAFWRRTRRARMADYLLDAGP